MDCVSRFCVLLQLRGDQVQKGAGFFADVWRCYLREVRLETDDIRERGGDRSSCEPRSLARELCGAPGRHATQQVSLLSRERRFSGSCSVGSGQECPTPADE